MIARVRTSGKYDPIPISATMTVEDKLSCSAAVANRLYWSGIVTDWQGEVCRMHDFVTPGFHRKVDRGEVFFKPMTHVRSTIYPAKIYSELDFMETPTTCSGVDAYRKRWHYYNCAAQWVEITPTPVGGDYTRGHVILPEAFSQREVDGLMNEASTSCLANRGTSSNNLYETMAEAKQAATLLPSLFGAAAKVVSRKASLFKRARETGSAWLAYRYGLSPIMSDIEAVTKGIQKAIGHHRVTTRGFATASRTVMSTGSSSAWGSTSVTIQSAATQSLVMRAMSLDETVATLSSNIGFSDKSLVTLPWELLPYSFVVDWFVNVGDYLNAIVPAFGVNQLGSCLVYEDTRSLIKTIVDTTMAPTVGTMYSPWSASKAATVVTKTRSTAALQPRLLFKSDYRFDEFKRSADGAALVVQKLKSK